MADRKKRSFVRRGATIMGTLIFIAGAGLAVLTGAQALTARADAVPPPTGATVTPVTVESIAFEDGYTVSRRFIGQVEAGADASLSFELGGKLTYLSAGEGEIVQEGQVIAKLDIALLEAEQARLQASRDATAAQLVLALSRLARANELQDEGFASQEAVDQAVATRDELESRIAEVDAALASVRINLEKSVLIAPFSGTVGAQNVEVAETLSAGQSVMTLIESANPMVRVGLPLRVDPAILNSAEIMIGSDIFPARLSQLRPDIDPVTRTRTALFAVETETLPTFGQTATLILQMPVAARGAWIPLDALQEGSGSVWTVLIVEDETVRASAVELLHTEDKRAFVRGTFTDGARLIQAGGHRVVPGQQVSVLMAEG